MFNNLIQKFILRSISIISEINTVMTYFWITIRTIRVYAFSLAISSLQAVELSEAKKTKSFDRLWVRAYTLKDKIGYLKV